MRGINYRRLLHDFMRDWSLAMGSERMIQLFNDRRELDHLGSKWIPNGDLNESLKSLSRYADFYLVTHRSYTITMNRVFTNFHNMIDQLKIDAMGGDELSIYPIFLENCIVNGFVPDLDGLIPYSK